jgi:hypothetical protein
MAGDMTPNFFLRGNPHLEISKSSMVDWCKLLQAEPRRRPLMSVQGLIAIRGRRNAHCCLAYRDGGLKAVKKLFPTYQGSGSPAHSLHQFNFQVPRVLEQNRWRRPINKIWAAPYGDGSNAVPLTPWQARAFLELSYLRTIVVDFRVSYIPQFNLLAIQDDPDLPPPPPLVATPVTTPVKACRARPAGSGKKGKVPLPKVFFMYPTFPIPTTAEINSMSPMLKAAHTWWKVAMEAAKSGNAYALAAGATGELGEDTAEEVRAAKRLEVAAGNVTPPVFFDTRSTLRTLADQIDTATSMINSTRNNLKRSFADMSGMDPNSPIVPLFAASNCRKLFAASDRVTSSSTLDSSASSSSSGSAGG